jgi:hypothetical protein
MENNIHLIRTDKPSCLFKNIKGNLGFNTEWNEIPFGRINQNIYITNSEKPKHGDWHIHKQINYLKVSNSTDIPMDGIKVILTTDPNLIQDGVQSISDEFIQWIVKNPNCERVEVQYWFDSYKILIPKEDPKKEPKKKKKKEKNKDAAEYEYLASHYVMSNRRMGF